MHLHTGHGSSGFADASGRDLSSVGVTDEQHLLLRRTVPAWLTDAAPERLRSVVSSGGAEGDAMTERWLRRRGTATGPQERQVVMLPAGDLEIVIPDAGDHAGAYIEPVPAEFVVELRRDVIHPHGPDAVSVWVDGVLGGRLPTWEAEQLWPLLGRVEQLGVPSTTARTEAVLDGFWALVRLPDPDVLRAWLDDTAAGAPAG
jgi:hypothetical protein